MQNNLMEFLKGVTVDYSQTTQILSLVMPDGTKRIIAEIRGWGWIKTLLKDEKGLCDINRVNDFQDEIGKFITQAITEKLNNNSPTWIDFDFNDLTKRPIEYGKHLICRKDGKIHWETWNGSGWAYNHNEIVKFLIIPKPL